MRLRWSLVLISACIAGVVAGTGAALHHVSTAQADCQNTHRLTDAENDGADLVSHRGNRTHGGMWVESTNASCVRISSIFIIGNDQRDWNEVGWFDAEGVPGYCGYSGSGPHLLWSARDNTVDYCPSQSLASLTKGQYDTFTVQNPLADGQWEYWHNGSQFKSFSNPHFPSGLPTTNGERHSTGDQAYAEFEGMQWENGSGYNDWFSPTAYLGINNNTNNDPNWCNRFDSDTHIEVVSC